MTPQPACVGEVVVLRLTNAVDPTQPISLPGDSLYWSFGTNGPAMVRTSISINEYGMSFAQPGIFTFSVQLMRQGRFVRGWFGGAIIEGGPAVRLGPDTTVCGPVAVRLAPRNTLAVGSTLRWPDGSTGPSFLATAPGTYWLEVSSPGRRCSSRVPRVIRAGTNCGAAGDVNWPAAGLIPNIITANGDGSNDYFVLDGLVAAEWRLQVFNRWGREVFQQAAYDNGWAAQGQAPGLYYYLLRHTPSGQMRRGWLEVTK